MNHVLSLNDSIQTLSVLQLETKKYATEKISRYITHSQTKHYRVFSGHFIAAKKDE